MDVTQWLVIGDFAVVMAQAFADEYVKSSSPTTRYGSARSIINGFVPFMVKNEFKIHQASDISPDLLALYREHLDAHTTDKGEKLASFTKLNYWRHVVAVFKRIRKQDPTIELDIPTRPFAGTNFSPVGNKAPDNQAITATLLQAAKDALETISLVDAFLPKLEEAIARLDEGATWRSDVLADVVAEILRQNDGTIPPQKDLKHTELGRAADSHGFLLIRRLVHPVANDVMPFFLLMAGHSGWNEQPLAHLAISRCEVKPLLGHLRLTMASDKLRANSIVRRSFAITNNQLSPNEIVEFVKRWTKILRAVAPDAVQDDLWLHHVTKAGANPRDYIDSLAGRFNRTTTKPSSHVAYYCKKRGLKYTGLREMRLSFSELVSTATGGDVFALRELLGHKRLTTQNAGYRTVEMRRRDAEALAGVQAARERFISSGGKIDTRTASEKRDRSAATPGFTCVDPFDSPRFGQRKGRMCDAYGHCPSCPMASSDPDEPYALARFVQLHDQYEQAKGKLGIGFWKAKYLVDAQMLIERWIPAVSHPDTVAAAREMLLSPLPALE